jgi:hypothetical protein
MAILVVAICFLGMKPYRTPGYLNLKFANYVGDQPLVLDSVKYKNELGQDFTVTNFKYYISNLKFHTKEGATHSSGEVLLIRSDQPENFQWKLRLLPDGDYTSVSFTIGVDSILNCSGAQSGALDPVNGMFWAWNTGYVFLKLEGKSSFSKSPGNIYEYHIGGYRSPVNCNRQVTLDFSDRPLSMRKGRSADLIIKADVLEILKNPVTVDISKLSSVTDFNHATEFADNYKDMFSVLKAKHER